MSVCDLLRKKEDGMSSEQTRPASAAPPTAASDDTRTAQHDIADHDAAEQEEEQQFTPRGTLLFLLVMLLGYALYWAYLWFIVVIERGAGGA
jgi:hypothetical protein